MGVFGARTSPLQRSQDSHKIDHKLIITWIEHVLTHQEDSEELNENTLKWTFMLLCFHICIRLPVVRDGFELQCKSLSTDPKTIAKSDLPKMEADTKKTSRNTKSRPFRSPQPTNVHSV